MATVSTAEKIDLPNTIPTSLEAFDGLRQVDLWTTCSQSMSTTSIPPTTSVMDYSDGGTADERKELENEVAKYVTSTWPNLNGFVLFATIGRYEIDFPSRWEKVETEAAPDKK
jgi:hypothetical protein